MTRCHRENIPREPHLVALLQAADDAVDGGLEVDHGDEVLGAARGDQRGLVAHVRDVRARKPGRQRCQALAAGSKKDY